MFPALAFVSPWLLLALASLPLIYWLLRTVPPRPKQIEFPPTRILVDIENKEKTPAKTPWWLLLIRLLAAALVIFALAEPILNPNREVVLDGKGPVAIIVDNGWASGSKWADRAGLAQRLIDEAEQQNRAIAIIGTAAATKAPVARIEAPADARATLAALAPMPFAPDRKSAMAALTARSPAASSVHSRPDPANAMKKKTSVSITEATSEPISGAFHQEARRQRLNTAMSSTCATMKAQPEASAMRHGASASETATATAKPIQATRRASAGPAPRLTRSVTRKTSG